MHSKMEEISDFPNEYIQPVLQCISVLERCHFQMLEKNKSIWINVWKFCVKLPCVVIFQLSLTFYLRECFQGSIQLAELAYVISILVVNLQTDLKTWIVISNKDRIRSIILQLGQMWRIQDLTEVQIIKKNVLLRRINLCYKVFYAMNMIGSMQYILTPLLETLLRRYILHQECELLFPFYCSFPFNPTGNWAIYMVTYVFEGFSMFQIVFCYMGTEFLMIILCSHLATQFTILKEDFDSITPGSQGDVEKLKNIVVRHQKLISLTKQLNGVFNKMIFFNLLSATITICFFGLSAKVAKGFIDMVNNFIAVVALILPIFNLCYYSELLREASSGLAVSAYNHKWYKGQTSYQKLMWFIMRRAQLECGLTSMDSSPIALHTFTKVLSTTWSYFSLVSSLYESES